MSVQYGYVYTDLQQNDTGFFKMADHKDVLGLYRKLLISAVDFEPFFWFCVDKMKHKEREYRVELILCLNLLISTRFLSAINDHDVVI